MRRSRATPPAVSRTAGACWLCWLCWLLAAGCWLLPVFSFRRRLWAVCVRWRLPVFFDGCEGKGTDGRWVVAGQKAPACNNCANRGLGSNCLWDDELGAFHGAEGEEQEEAGRVR